jgi:hypothetical protein
VFVDSTPVELHQLCTQFVVHRTNAYLSCCFSDKSKGINIIVQITFWGQEVRDYLDLIIWNFCNHSRKSEDLVLIENPLHWKFSGCQYFLRAKN